MTTALERLRDALRDAGCNPRGTAAKCPAHDDRKPSLSFGPAKQFPGVVVNCLVGCHLDDVLAAIEMTVGDLFDNPRDQQRGYTVVTEYPYRDESDQVLYFKERRYPKDFRQYHLVNGEKVWNLNGVRRVLYRLPEILGPMARGETIYLCEGEKDAEEVAKHGHASTTWTEGAWKAGAQPKWRNEYSKLLDGTHVCIIQHRDKKGSGQATAFDIATELKRHAKSVRIVEPAEGNDAYDHLNAGLTITDFIPINDEESDPPEHDAPQQFTPGGSFILDTDPTPQALWGEGEHVIWPDGEALIIAGTQGLGKTTLAGQLALGRCGFAEYSDLLGYPIKPGRRRVLYLAMDRPKQAARSFRRMVGEEWRQVLDEVLMVWQGPPAHDLAKYPSLLLKLSQDADADTVIVDSLKDAAIGLSDDEVGAGYNRARQTALAAGIQIAELHHPRKDKENKRTEIILDDLYGSTWLTSGAGSVIGLIGKPGDPIVKLHHLKQPATEIGPFTVIHDDKTGRSTIWHAVDLVELVQARGTISAIDVARALYDTDKPTPSEKETTRRKLDRLVNSGHLWVVDPGDQKTNRPKTWAAK